MDKDPYGTYSGSRVLIHIITNSPRIRFILRNPVLDPNLSELSCCTITVISSVPVPVKFRLTISYKIQIILKRKIYGGF